VPGFQICFAELGFQAGFPEGIDELLVVPTRSLSTRPRHRTRRKAPPNHPLAHHRTRHAFATPLGLTRPAFTFHDTSFARDSTGSATNDHSAVPAGQLSTGQNRKQRLPIAPPEVSTVVNSPLITPRDHDLQARRNVHPNSAKPADANAICRRHATIRAARGVANSAPQRDVFGRDIDGLARNTGIRSSQ